MNKAQAQMRHAIHRAQERYGLELNRDTYASLCQDIQNGVGVYLGKQSNRLSVWRITAILPETLESPGPVGTVTCHVLYDKERHTIVTFLPPGITDAKGVDLT